MKHAIESGIGRQRFEPERLRATHEIIVHMPGDTTVGTSATTLYTVPDNKFFLIEELSVTNVSGSTEFFNLYMVPDGGSAAIANATNLDEQIVTKTSLRIVTVSGLTMSPKATLQALTTTSGGINVTFWGVEITGI